MIIYNVKIFTENMTFVQGKVTVSGGMITDITYGENSCPEAVENGEVQVEYLNGKGCYLIPGMIDIHLHGCKGDDFCDGTLEAVERIGAYQASIGVTTIAPATMTLPVERLEEILQQVAAYQEKKFAGEYDFCADVAGINMEGPFISEAKKGAQKSDFIRKPEVELYERFQKAAGGLVKYMGVAPEVEGALEFIRESKDNVKVTLAHSEGNYETAMAAFEAGAVHVTHLYNGMTAYSHREPGIVGAVYDCKAVEAELIGDGLHVHPAVIRATFDMLGKERIILISDSIRATGMEPGEYELGGQKVTLEKNRAVLSNTETLAGSVATLPEVLRYVVKEAGIPLEDAIQCVTINPAVSLGIYEKCGSITEGKKADLVLLDEELMVTRVMKDGNFL